MAAAVAGIRGMEGKSFGPFRVFLEPVAPRGFGFTWDEGSTSAVWSNRSLAANLAAVFGRRQMEAFRSGFQGVPIQSRRPASLADVLAFLRKETDDEKLGDLLWGLPAIDWSTVKFQVPPPADPEDVAIPFEFGVPRLLVEPLPLMAKGGSWQFDKTAAPTTPEPDVFHVLASGRLNAVGECIDRAARRLKSDGRIIVGYGNRRQAGKSLAVVSPLRPDRLLASMLFPLSDLDLRTIARFVLCPPESEE